ncbi:MAG: SUF system Fe-S cluster assembly regulator [Gammaproteobacteria bacterium]
MLRMSKLTDYAIVLLAHMAKDQTHLYTTVDITAQTRISHPTASKLLKILSKSNLVESKRGTHGGYRLHVSPETIALSQIIEAVEGNISLTECSGKLGQCTIENNCAIRRNWQLLSNHFRHTLDGITLADMTKPLQLPLLTKVLTTGTKHHDQ